MGKKVQGLQFKGVASNSMSAWFSILLISAPVFAQIYAGIDRSEDRETSSIQRDEVFLLPKKLQDVVTML